MSARQDRIRCAVCRQVLKGTWWTYRCMGYLPGFQTTYRLCLACGRAIRGVIVDASREYR